MLYSIWKPDLINIRVESRENIADILKTADVPHPVSCFGYSGWYVMILTYDL